MASSGYLDGEIERDCSITATALLSSTNWTWVAKTILSEQVIAGILIIHMREVS